MNVRKQCPVKRWPSKHTCSGEIERWYFVRHFAASSWKSHELALEFRSSTRRGRSGVLCTLCFWRGNGYRTSGRTNIYEIARKSKDREKQYETHTQNTHLSSEAPGDQYLFGGGLSADDRRPAGRGRRHGPAGRRRFARRARRRGLGRPGRLAATHVVTAHRGALTSVIPAAPLPARRDVAALSVRRQTTLKTSTARNQ